jgi:hypothetical protein
MYYLYRHIRLDKNEPFYIGIGTVRKTPKTLKSKYDRAYNKHETGRNIVWHRITSITDYEIEIIFETDNKELIKEKEREFIKMYGIINEGGILCNMTYGGDGVNGWIPNEEIREKMSSKKKGKLNPNYGKPLSESHRLKIKQSNLGRKLSPESCERVRAGNWCSKKVFCVSNGIIYDSAAHAGKCLFPDIKRKTSRTNISRAINKGVSYKNIIFQWLV